MAARRRSPPLFVFGTLLDPGIRAAVLGERWRMRGQPARLYGYRRLFVRGAEYPALRPALGAVTQGLLLPAPDAAGLARLDVHEGDEYLRQAVLADRGGRLIWAQTYLSTPLASLTGRIWRPGPRWGRRREGYYRRQFGGGRRRD